MMMHTRLQKNAKIARFSAPKPLLQRKETFGKKGSETAQPAALVVSAALQSSGQALDETTRASMQARFGHDFSRVRVHTDEKASESARAVGADAYTTGKDIFFQSGQYQPNTAEGKRLLAHELTHVVQQSGQTTSSPSRLEINPPDDAFEREADQIADTVSAPAPSRPLQIMKKSLQKNGSATIQRSASFKSTKPLEITNLSTQILLGRDDAGYTAPHLNGKEITSAEDVVAAIHRPQLAHRALGKFGPARPPVNMFNLQKTSFSADPTHAGLVEQYRSEHGIPTSGMDETGEPVGPSAGEIKYRSLPQAECWIEKVPDNVGSFTETVLTPGNWKMMFKKTDLLEKLSRLNVTGLKKCAETSGSGGVRLDVVGDPSDAAVAASVRAHEDRHAKGIEDGFNQIVVPWDRAISAAKASGKTFQGASNSACEAALFAAVGGTPDEIAKKLFETWTSDAAAFHKTSEGQPVSIQKVSENADCSVVTLTVK